MPELTTALSNSFSFGGHNASIIPAPLGGVLVGSGGRRVRLLRDPDRLERGDPGRARRRLFGDDEDELNDLVARYHALEPELQRDGEAHTYREVMTEAMRQLGAPEGEEG